MAINEGALQKMTDGDDSLTITFDNGDLKALDDIQRKWRFKDKASLLKFAMAILLKSENNKIIIAVENGETPVTPAKELLETSDSTNQDGK